MEVRSNTTHVLLADYCDDLDTQTTFTSADPAAVEQAQLNSAKSAATNAQPNDPPRNPLLAPRKLSRPLPSVSWTRGLLIVLSDRTPRSSGAFE